MKLILSLLDVLEHQLQNASDLQSLKSTVTLIEQQLENASPDLGHGLQTLLLSHANKYLSLLESRSSSDPSSSLLAVATCTPLYSVDTVWTIIDVIITVKIERELALDLLISIGCKGKGIICEMKEKVSNLLEYLLTVLEEVLAEDNFEVAKKVGRLLRVILPLCDDQVFYRVEKVLLSYTESLSSMYMVLSALIDYLVADSFRLRNCQNILVEGIKSKEMLVRKQSVYVIKTILDAFDKGVLDVAQCSVLSLDTSRKELFLAAWSEYILMAEGLQEKQYHIIQPNFTRMDNILTYIHQGVLSVDWMFALFAAMLNHDNMQVKKFGVLYALNLDYKKYPEFITETSLPTLYKQLILMANQSPFFTRRPDQNQNIIPDVYIAMKSYLHNVTAALKEDNYRAVFLHGVIESAHANWSPVPCMYWMAALSSLDDPSLKDCLNESTLSVVLKIMSNKFIFCDRRIRQATYCYLLTAVLNLSQITASTAPIIYSMVVYLRSDKVLVCGGTQWRGLTSALTAAIEAGHVDRASVLNSRCREEMAVMLLTSSGGTELCEWLKNTCEDILSSCHVRAYINRETVVNALYTVLYVYELVVEPEAKLWIEKLIQKISESISQYIIQLIAQKVSVPSDEVDTFILFLKHSSQLKCEQLIRKLCDRVVKTSLVQNELEWRLLGVVFSMEINRGNESQYETCMQTIMNITSNKRLGLSEAYARWTVHYQYLLMASPTEVDWNDWYSEAMDALSMLYREDSGAVFNCFRLILVHVDVKCVAAAAESLLVKVEEEKNSHYLPMVSKLMETVFSEGLVMNKEYDQVLSQTFDSLYEVADIRPGIANIVSRQLHAVITSSSAESISDWLYSSIVQLAIYGPNHNRPHRTLEDAFLFLEEVGTLRTACLLNEKRVGYKLSNREVRVLAVDTAVYLSYSSDAHVVTHHCSTILGMAIAMYNDLLAVKCYNNFPNAPSHRQRHRLMCLLLALLPASIQDDEMTGMVLEFVQCALRKELQPSCRQQLEWMYIYVMKRKRHLIPHQVIELMHPNKLVKERASYVCSFFCVAAHVCSFTSPPADCLTQLEVIKEIVPLVTPWSMSSKFQMRMHAQAALMKIWRDATNAGQSDYITSHFPILKANMDFAFLSGTATEKTCRKLLEHFIYFKFDAVEDFNIETIFTLWPRLLMLADGEIIPASLFSEFTRSVIPEKCLNDELRTCDPRTWLVKVKEGDTETELLHSNLQKKIVTWRTLKPSIDSPLHTDTNRQDGLILVTSLIGKLPNLGGLCRTAEIFGAAEMVVNSLKSLEDANFLSTSVTAQRWLPMKQVPYDCLSDYLIEMKEYGYTVVAAEQVTNSRCLTDYKMPLKSLLLLGNEKQGIPADLIQLVDVCVEIPQQGLVRSLNVHVTGALFIWEYRKQALLRQLSQ